MTEISFDQARQFRASALGHGRLVVDEWDETSEHHGLFRDSELIATFRLVKPRALRLPVSEHVPVLPVSENDLQVGRFATTPAQWDRGAGIFFLDHYKRSVITRGDCLYVAVPTVGPVIIPIRHYEKMDFQRTGHHYFDARYGKSFHILVRVNRPAVHDASTMRRTEGDRSPR